MAREATLVVQKTIPVNFTVADATGIEKGTLLKLADPATVSASSATNDIVGGFAYNEKIASDGVTKLAVLRGPGDWLKVTASGAVSIGDPVGIAQPGNYLRSLKGVSNLSGGFIVGNALETAADEDTFLMELNITGVTYL